MEVRRELLCPVVECACVRIRGYACACVLMVVCVCHLSSAIGSNLDIGGRHGEGREGGVGQTLVVQRIRIRVVYEYRGARVPRAWLWRLRSYAVSSDHCYTRP